MFELAQQVGRDFGPRFIERGGHHEMWIGPLAALLFVALLVAGAIVIVRMLVNRQQPGGSGSRGPIQILEERFARGEIDEEEFRTRRDALRN